MTVRARARLTGSRRYGHPAIDVRTSPCTALYTRSMPRPLCSLGVGFLVACGGTGGLPAPPAPLAGAPDGFEAVALPPAATDDCQGDAMWIGLESTRRDETILPSDVELLGRSETPPPAPADLESDVAAFMAPLAGRLFLSWVYNGPGGEPYFRARMRATERPLLFFDRRLPRARFDDAIRGARSDLETPIRIGGQDAAGARACAVVLLDAWPEVAVHRAWADEDGALLAAIGEHTILDRARIGPGSEPAAFPGEAATGVRLLAVEAAPAISTSALLSALALARWQDHRYGALLAVP